MKKCVALVTLLLFTLTLFLPPAGQQASQPGRHGLLPVQLTAKPSKPTTPARAQKAARFLADLWLTAKFGVRERMNRLPCHERQSDCRRQRHTRGQLYDVHSSHRR